VAALIYLKHRVDARRVEPDLLLRGWRVDEAMAAFFAGPGRKLADLTAFVVDAKGVDGAVNGIAAVVRSGGQRLRVVQTGYMRSYALALAAGAVLLLAFFLTRSGIA